jgi:thioredoxin-dependent peroxiredoxin
MSAARKKSTPAAPALEHKAPDFMLPATGDNSVHLKDLLGTKVVLYFYPRDNTSGCTLEGQQFAALAPRFAKAGAVVFGISRDSIAAHEKFRDKMQFPFALLSDEDGHVCRLFDVIHEKNMYGRKVLGIVRSTFLIDAKSVLRGEWRRVKVEGHAQQVLAAAQAL